MSAFLDDGARLQAAVQAAGARTTLVLTGELDRVSALPLAKLLAATLGGALGHLVVDMGLVSFVDVGGARVLMHAHRLAAERGVVLTLRDPQPHVVRVLRIMDPDNPLLADRCADGRVRDLQERERRP